MVETIQEHVARRGISWSSLKHIFKSPLHWRYEYEHRTPSTDAQVFGSLVHKIVLGGEFEYVVWEGGDKRKFAKAWKDFKKEHAGVPIVSSEDYMRAAATASAVLNNKLAKPQVDHGDREVELMIDHPSGLRIKGMVDLLGRDWLSDLKTCGDLSKFMRDAQSYHYAGQCAMYERLAERPINHSYLIAAENHGAHDVGVIEIGRDKIAMWDKKITAAIATLVDCLDRDLWPGIMPEVETLDLKPWEQEASL